MTFKWYPPNGTDLVKLHMKDGVSVLQLSKKFRVSRTAITGELIRLGCTPRSRADAEKLKWAQRKIRPDYRTILIRQCGAAWNATLGQPRTFATRCKNAASMNGKIRRPTKH